MAEIGQGVVGFAVIKVVGEEAYLSNVLVAREYRRKGLGCEILQKVIMEVASRGARELILDVDTANEPAIAMYRKIGFEVLQQRNKSYPRGEDAFIMRKKI